jgi:predicted Zn-dependent protease
MKHAILLLLLSSLCAAQSDDEMNSLVHDLAARLRSPDGVQQYAMPEFTAEITEDKEVNAHASGKKVSLNKALVKAFYNAPGELAFIIAHEIGHLQNEASCHDAGARMGVKGNALQRTCEAEADQVGMQYLLAAGFSFYDAAGAMGRLIMADPSRNSVIAIMFNRFTSDHPVSVDRIKKLAEYARQACEDRPEICQR